MQYYLAKVGGSTQQYEQNERNAVDQANQSAQQILNDIDGAVKYIVDGKNQHPNREDQVQKTASSFNWTNAPSLNQSSAISTGGTTFGQSSTSFGSSSTSAFGNPSTATPAFGQSSALGSGTSFDGASASGASPLGGGQAGSNSAFGKPSALGSGSAFGQPSSFGGGSNAFGKPSALGGASPFGAQNTSDPLPFGQSSSNAAASPFGQASSNNTGASPFSQASAPTGGSTFGQPSAPGNTTAFGQTSTPASNTAFGKPSAFGAAASTTPAFGSSTPFGAQAPSNTSAFGQPSQPAGKQASPFGQPTQQQPTFGNASPFGSTNGTTSTFAQPAFGSSSKPFGAATNTTAFGKPSAQPAQQPTFGSQQPAQPQPTAPFSSNAPGTRLTHFRNQPVTYARLGQKDGKPDPDGKEQPYYTNPATQKPERIWMASGAAPGANADVEALPQTYEALGAALEQLYAFVRARGVFEAGVVPEVPPKREWVGWEL